MSDTILPVDEISQQEEEPVFKTSFMERIFYWFEYDGQEINDPRNESFSSMLHKYLCPFSSLITFTFIMSTLILGIFIIQIVGDGLVDRKAKEFLEIDISGSMTSLFYNQHNLVKGNNHTLLVIP